MVFCAEAPSSVLDTLSPLLTVFGQTGDKESGLSTPFFCISTKVYLCFNQGLFTFQPRFICFSTKVYLHFNQGLFVFLPRFICISTVICIPTPYHQPFICKISTVLTKMHLRGRARTCREPFLSMTPEQCRR